MLLGWIKKEVDKLKDVMHYTMRLLRQQSVRTVLTVLQIALGVWAVSLILSANMNMKEQIREATVKYGQHLLAVTAGVTSESEDGSRHIRTRSAFMIEHIKALEESDNIKAAYIAESLGWNYGVVSNDQTYRLQGLVGATAEYLEITGIELIQGSFFANMDVEQGNRVIVISESVAHQLYPGELPLGKTMQVATARGVSVSSSRGIGIRTENLEFEVIGVFKDMDALQTNFVQLSHAIVPLGSQQQPSLGVDGVRGAFGALEGGNREAVVDILQQMTSGGIERFQGSVGREGPQVFGELRQIGSGAMRTYQSIVIEAMPGKLFSAADDAKVILQSVLRNDEELLIEYVKDKDAQLFETVNRVIYFFVGFGFIAVIISSVGILSVMLVSVAERTREIGLHRALGASKQWIQSQLLWESIILSGIGSALGLVAAAASARYVFNNLLLKAFWSDFGPSKATLNPYAILLSVCMTILAGLLFGLYPAKSAAALPPSDAFRQG